MEEKLSSSLKQTNSNIMTKVSTLEKFISATHDTIGEAFYSDTWRSTSYLIQVLGKTRNYLKHLNEDSPESGLYDAQIAVDSALALMNNTYKCPITDDRYEDVQNAYEATVNLFITEYSDDAFADIIFLANTANFVAGMRVHAINSWIEQTAPSEQKFEMLQLAKRDEMAVKLATKAASEVLFAD